MGGGGLCLFWWRGVFLLLPKMALFFCCYPVILALGLMKWQTAGKSALDLPRVKVGIPNTDFKHCVSQYNMLFPLGKN